VLRVASESIYLVEGVNFALLSSPRLLLTDGQFNNGWESVTLC